MLIVQFDVLFAHERWFESHRLSMREHELSVALLAVQLDLHELPFR